MRRHLTAACAATLLLLPACQSDDGPDVSSPGASTPTEGATTAEGPAPTSEASTPTPSPPSDSPSPTATATPTSKPGLPPIGVATSTLARRSGWAKPAVVRVGSTYEAATLAKKDRVVFWRMRQSTWTRDGWSTHPSTYEGARGVKGTVTGHLLPGADHAIFIVSGAYTGAGLVADTLAYGHSSGRWSMFLAQPDSSLKPWGHGSRRDGMGRELDIWVKGGHLHTASAWVPGSRASSATQGTYPILRTWRAKGDRLVMTGDNRQVAKEATMASYGKHAQPLPIPLRDGSYVASLEKVRGHGNRSVVLVLQPSTEHSGSCIGGTCGGPQGKPRAFTVDPDLPASVLVSADRIRAFTAPVWVLAAAQRGAPLREFSAGGPYTVPRKLLGANPSGAEFISTRSVRVQVEDGAIASVDALYHP